MLKGIHPLLRGNVLSAIDTMGHGDVCLIADANFPADRLSDHVIEIPGVDAPTVLEAVLTVFPLDLYGGPAVTLMSSENDTVAGPEAAAPMVAAFGAVVGSAEMVSLAREKFYDAAAVSRFIIRTGELRPYANVMLRKGVVND
jgi:L-fucose mutarotase